MSNLEDEKAELLIKLRNEIISNTELHEKIVNSITLENYLKNNINQ